MCDSTNPAWCIREIVQNPSQTIDTLPLPWYPLTHTRHFTMLNCRPATTPNHFAAACPRQNPLVPCGAAFFILTREFADGRPACNSLYPHLENCMSRLDLDTAPRPAQNADEPDNAAATQGQERRFGASGDHKQETLLFTNTPSAF